MGGDSAWLPGAANWRRENGCDRWVLGKFSFEPDFCEFVDWPDLLPLKLPSDAEIEEWWESHSMRREHYPNSIPYLCLMRDLSKNSTIMAEIGGDNFAAQFQCFLFKNDLQRISDGATVIYSSERNYGAILSTLRRYGEDYMMYNTNWAEADPAMQDYIRELIETAGYSVLK